MTSLATTCAHLVAINAAIDDIFAVVEEDACVQYSEVTTEFNAIDAHVAALQQTDKHLSDQTLATLSVLADNVCREIFVCKGAVDCVNTELTALKDYVQHCLQSLTTDF